MSTTQQGKNDVEESKAKYARGAYTNSRSPHIKDGISYPHGIKHNARETKNGKDIIKFTKGEILNKKQEKGKTINHQASFAQNVYAKASTSTCTLFHDFDASYVLYEECAL